MEEQQQQLEVTKEEAHIAALDYSTRKGITYDEAMTIVMDCVWYDEDGDFYMVPE